MRLPSAAHPRQMPRRLAAALALVLLPPPLIDAGATTTCPPNFFAPLGSSSCFSAVALPGSGLSWADADAYCGTVSSGARLATFPSRAEAAAVVAYGCLPADANARADDYWVGLTDEGHEGEWRWAPSSGAGLSAQAYPSSGGLWHVGAPNGNATQNCAMVTAFDTTSSGGQSRLEDQPCSKLARIACCQVPGSSPLPSMSPTPSPDLSRAAAINVATITYTSRYYDAITNGRVFTKASDYLAAWEEAGRVNASSLPAPNKPSWFCTTTLDAWASFNNEVTCGGWMFGVASNVSAAFYVRPRAGAATAALSFAFGVDAGRGGIVLLDGAVAALNTGDLWNSYSSFTVSASLAEGWHQIDVLVIETCCSGLAYVRGTVAVEGGDPMLLESGPVYPSASPTPSSSRTPSSSPSTTASHSVAPTRSGAPSRSASPTRSASPSSSASPSYGWRNATLAVVLTTDPTGGSTVGIAVGAAFGGLFLLLLCLACFVRRGTVLARARSFRGRRGSAGSGSTASAPAQHVRRRGPGGAPAGAARAGGHLASLAATTTASSSRSLVFAAGAAGAETGIPGSARGLVNPLFGAAREEGGQQRPSLQGVGDAPFPGRASASGSSGRALFDGAGRRGGPAGRGAPGQPAGGGGGAVTSVYEEALELHFGATHGGDGSGRALFDGAGRRGGPTGRGAPGAGAAAGAGHSGAFTEGYELDLPGRSPGGGGSARALFDGAGRRGGAVGRGAAGVPGGSPDAFAATSGAPHRPLTEGYDLDLPSHASGNGSGRALFGAGGARGGGAPGRGAPGAHGEAAAGRSPGPRGVVLDDEAWAERELVFDDGSARRLYGGTGARGGVPGRGVPGAAPAASSKAAAGGSNDRRQRYFAEKDSEAWGGSNHGLDDGSARRLYGGAVVRGGGGGSGGGGWPGGSSRSLAAGPLLDNPMHAAAAAAGGHSIDNPMHAAKGAGKPREAIGRSGSAHRMRFAPVAVVQSGAAGYV